MSAFYNVDQPPFNMVGSAARAIAAANNGAFFDASDMSTMYQDAAGTIPVTAMEQPVGLWKDKSGNGNRATQSVTASRPVISARKNLLLTTDALSTQSVTTVAAQQTLSFTGTGSVTLSGTATGTLAGTGVNNRVSLTFTPTAGTLMLTVSGDVRLGQLEYGPAATRYQKVNTSTDYDTAGFPRYLRFDKVDDYLNLTYMGLYANGSASVIAALSNLNNQTNESLVCEANNASFSQIYLPMTKISGSTYGAYIRNDQNAVLLNYLPVESYISPALIKAHVDTGSEFKMHRNSIDMTAVSYVRGGTLSPNIATIGCARQTSPFNFFGGRLYGLIITKSALTDAQRRACERHLSRKAGVAL